MSKKHTQAETYRIRYQMYRELGYSPAEARKLRSRALDVSKVKIREDQSIVKGKVYKEIVVDKKVDIYNKKQKNVINDTVYSRWGMLTRDKRYKDDTQAVVKSLQKQYGITHRQASYLLYFSISNNIPINNARGQLMNTEAWEEYKNTGVRGKKKVVG